MFFSSFFFIISLFLVDIYPSEAFSLLIGRQRYNFFHFFTPKKLTKHSSPQNSAARSKRRSALCSMGSSNQSTMERRMRGCGFTYLQELAAGRSPPPRLPQELLGSENVGVCGVGYGVVHCCWSITSQWPFLLGPI